MLTCPKCHETDAPAAQEGRVSVCGKCGGTLFEPENGDPIRPATLADINNLTETQRIVLVKARRPLIQRFKP